ncbi:MAG TPA: ATP-binding protein [Nitrospiraceae bacterium]|jgi:heavy metal sensor kinase|nr:ATP-binding protein [Nitrospiraceae bacterium]
MKSLRSLIRQSVLMLMAGLLLVFSVLMYVGGDALLRRFVDDRLLGLAETLAKIVEQHPNIIESSGEDFALAAEVGRSEKEQHELQEVTHSLLVFSPDGRVVWKGPGAVAQHPVPNDAVFERVRHGNTVFETVESADGTPIRHLFLPIPRQGQVRYVLHAEASLLLYQKTLKGLVILLTVGSGTILLVAWVGGGWLAKKVLTPIEVLSTGAETMSEADLGKRLTLDSPYQEFRRLTQAFNSVMDRFQRSGEIQRSFCDIAAHEMKTPLTILQGNLEVALLKARTSEEYREALINNLEQVGRLIALTRSLLTLAKFTSGKPPVHLVPLALEPMIQDMVDELTLLADDRRITLLFESQSVPPVLGDAQWLKQALINLLDNALHYTPSGGAVTVRLQAVGEGVAVAVEDTGHGIEPEHLPHLFERFYRTDWARAKDSGGTGLGLPIVKEIAEAHGGTISVTSQVDKGSVFTLRLPVPTHQTIPA